MEDERSIQLFITEDSSLSEEELGLDVLINCSKNLIEQTNQKGNFSAGIRICKSDVMKELHDYYMDDDSDTDVLAFPSDDEEGDYLGDIIVCEDVAKKCSEEFSNDFKTELQFYCLHGLLHLLGYEDDKPELKEEMLGMQQKALLSEGLTVNL